MKIWAQLVVEVAGSLISGWAASSAGGQPHQRAGTLKMYFMFNRCCVFFWGNFQLFQYPLRITALRMGSVQLQEIWPNVALNLGLLSTWASIINTSTLMVSEISKGKQTQTTQHNCTKYNNNRTFWHLNNRLLVIWIFERWNI